PASSGTPGAGTLAEKGVIVGGASAYEAGDDFRLTDYSHTDDLIAALSRHPRMTRLSGGTMAASFIDSSFPYEVIHTGMLASNEIPALQACPPGVGPRLIGEPVYMEAAGGAYRMSRAPGQSLKEWRKQGALPP